MGNLNGFHFLWDFGDIGDIRDFRDDSFFIDFLGSGIAGQTSLISQ